MKRTFTASVVFGLTSFALLSCSNYNGSQTGSRSGLKFRAFVSNPVHPSNAGGGVPTLDIIDASKDVQSRFAVSLVGSEPDAGMMAESPKRDRTLVYSPSNNGLAIVNNATESVSLTISLSGPTESMYVWTDNTTAFVASPTVTISGQPQGGVGVINIATGAVNATIPVPSAHYLVPSPDGSRILVLSDTTNTVSVLNPTLINNGTAVVNVAGSFDRPAGAVFSADGSTAYILNCGLQCGGTAASVAVVDMLQNPPVVTGAPIPVPAATVAFLQGTNLYVAGTPPPPANDCSGANPATAAAGCGRLTVIDTTTLTPSAPATITDGYHSLMQMGANGQLFIGARHCSGVNISGGEVRGCLTIVNTTTGAVVVPPAIGDVTGIQPISNRNVVYVCEGGALQIYDTTTDALQTTTQQPNVVGQAIDVKLVDF